MLTGDSDYLHKHDRWPCSTKILLPYLFITPTKTKTEPKAPAQPNAPHKYGCQICSWLADGSR